MSNQLMDMQFADPDWQPASSQPGQTPSEIIPPIRAVSDRSTDSSQKTTPQQHASPPSKSHKSRRPHWLLAFVARAVLVLIWVTTPLVTRAFHEGWIVPLLGVLFLPLTALTYTIVSALSGSVTGLGWLWVVGALLLDLACSSGQTSTRRRSPAEGKRRREQ